MLLLGMLQSLGFNAQQTNITQTDNDAIKHAKQNILFYVKWENLCLKYESCFSVPPSVHMKEEVKTVIAGQETNVSLLCLVDGHPKPNINWTM